MNEERFIIETDKINAEVFGLIICISGWKSLTYVQDIKITGCEWNLKLPPTCTEENICFEDENLSLLSPTVIVYFY